MSTSVDFASLYSCHACGLRCVNDSSRSVVLWENNAEACILISFLEVAECQTFPSAFRRAIERGRCELRDEGTDQGEYALCPSASAPELRQQPLVSFR